MNTRRFDSAAGVISKKLGPSLAREVILQIFIKNTGTTAHLRIPSGVSNGHYVLRDGPHSNPNLVVYLNDADLADICELGCVREYVAIHGESDVISIFRLAFMSTTSEHKRSVESRSVVRGPFRIERVSVNSMTAKMFFKNHAVDSVPVVIADAMPKWREGKFTIRDLRKQGADANIALRMGDYVANIYSKEMQTSVTTLSAYLEQCEAFSASNSNELPPYAASNIAPHEWVEWLDYPPFVPQALCGYAKFWLGPAGTVTPMHRDWADNFLTQLEGSKEVALISPGSSNVLTPREVHQYLDSCPGIDPEQHEELEAKGVRVFFVTLDAGEMLYIPAGWFHHVRSLSLSFSVNYFLQRVPYAACPPREDH